MMAIKLFTRSFLMIMFINFLLHLSFSMITPSLPIYFDNVGIGSAMAGFCVAAFTIGSIFVRPIAGGIIDHFSRRKIFFISTLLLCPILFGYSLSISIIFLLLLCIIHGFDWGFVSTSTNTLAADTIPRHIMGQGIAIFSTSMSFAIAIAPSLALILMDRLTFPGMMRVNIFIIISALFVALFFPFHTYSHHTESSIKPYRFQKSSIFERSALLPAIIVCCVAMTCTAVITYVPIYALSLNFEASGIFFIIYAIGLIIVRLFIGSVVDHFGATIAILPSFLCLALALFLLSQLNSISMLLLSGFLYGVGYGGSQSTLQSLAVMNAPSTRYGAANGTFFVGFDFGYGIGALLAGILSNLIGYSNMYLVLILFLVIATILVLKFHPQKQFSINEG
ncbi:MAG: MFS transporter [Peptococcaceae bacterium]|nr:MFS transporter [Peptococcaceae bacterium]